MGGWEVGADESIFLNTRSEDATEDVGAVCHHGFNRPVLLGLGILYECQTSLVFVGGSSAPNVIALRVSDVYLVVLFCFKRNADIDVLVGQCPAQRDESAVARVLDVVAGDRDTWGSRGG